MPRVLLSVSDKTGLTAFARGLIDLGYEIVSTGGTLKALAEAEIPAIAVENITQFPECFGGRVKTMHPAIVGGVLFRRENKSDQKQAKDLGIEPIDLIVVNLYPFEETARKPGISRAEMIEQIDVGGPTLLRSAAKNAVSVLPVCDPADYERVLAALQGGDVPTELRDQLAAKVFLRVSAYDAAIAEALSGGAHCGVTLTNRMQLRYGENPHQWGAYYDRYGTKRAWTIVQEEKQMSYLNILDADAAWNLVAEYGQPAAACIKHANPSGVAVAEDIVDAFQKSYDADRLSAFGVIISLNRSCSGEIIQRIIDQKIFAEVLIAPDFSAEAVALLKGRPKLRAIAMQASGAAECIQARTALGGVLLQNEDKRVVTIDDLTCVTDRKPTEEAVRDLLFAWTVVKHAKSNAIVLAKDRATVGIGCGQTSRVDSTWIALRRAGDRAKGSVLASDAFFPFADSIQEAGKAGIAAIIQPGGSVRDEEVIAAANAAGIPMLFTGVRAFRH